MPVGYRLWAQQTSNKCQSTNISSQKEQGKFNLIRYLSEDKIQVLHDNISFKSK